ncbi:unnamed protein product, partial [Symbiodinium necroappetens]
MATLSAITNLLGSRSAVTLNTAIKDGHFSAPAIPLQILLVTVNNGSDKGHKYLRCCCLSLLRGSQLRKADCGDCASEPSGANMVRPSDRFEAFLLSMHPWRRGPGDALQAMAETLKLPSAQVSKVQPKEGLWKEVDAKLANEASDEAYDVAMAALAKAQQVPAVSSIATVRLMSSGSNAHVLLANLPLFVVIFRLWQWPALSWLFTSDLQAGETCSSKHLKAAFLSPGDSAMARTEEGVLAPAPSRREGLAGLATSLALPLAGFSAPVRAEDLQ